MQWVSATTLLFRAFALTKKAISTIIALDTAMIDLRKTTEATEEEYRKFFHTANDTAKALGVTTEEVISQLSTSLSPSHLEDSIYVQLRAHMMSI